MFLKYSSLLALPVCLLAQPVILATAGQASTQPAAVHWQAEAGKRQASQRASEVVGAQWLNGGFSSRFRLASGSLVMEPSAGADCILIHTGTPITQGEAFALEVTARLNTTAPSGWAGIVFGYQDAQNYYLLAFSGAGRLRFQQFVDGQPRQAGRPGNFAYEKNAPIRLGVILTAEGKAALSVRSANGTILLAEELPPVQLPEGFSGIYANTSLASFSAFSFEATPVPSPAAIAHMTPAIEVAAVTTHTTQADPATLSIESVRAALAKHDANPPRYRNHKLEQAARFALETPRINTDPLPQYATERLDYGMGMGLEATPSGRIWAAWNPGSDGPEGFIVAATSDDAGKSWSEPRLVIDNRDPAHLPYQRSTMHTVFWTAPDGRLWLFFDQAMNKWDGRAGVWYSVCDNPDADNPQWSEPVRIADGFPVRKPIVRSNGEWLLPVTLHHFDVGAFHELDPMRQASVYASTNEGKTWSYRGGVRAPRPHCDEHNLVELADGRIWMTLRTAEGLFESFSADGGATWTPPTRSATIAQPTAMHYVGRLRSGALLLIKNGTKVDQMPKGNRVGMTAFLSRDEGKTWQGGLVLDHRGRVSHPDAFQMPDGTIYATSDYERPTKGEILLHRFTEEDILAGKPVSANAQLGMLIFKPTPEALQKRLDAEARGERPRKQ